MLKRLALLALPTLAVVGAFTGLSFAKTAPHVRADERYVALTGTIRAAFYYPWFPSWGSDPQNPFTNYLPTRGRYSTDVATVKRQIADMQYGRVRLGLASWFGRSSNTNTHWPVLIQAARGTGFKWAPYYEPEGISIRRRPRSPPTCTTCAGGTTRVGVGHVAGQADARVRLQRGRHDTRPRLCDGDPLEAGQAASCSTSTARRSTSTSRCSPATRRAPTREHRRLAPVRPGQRRPGLPRRRATGRTRSRPGFWKAGNAYGTAPFLARDRARWQASIASDERLEREVAADHDVQRVGRGHGDRELLRLWSPRRRAPTATGAPAAAPPN